MGPGHEHEPVGTPQYYSRRSLLFSKNSAENPYTRNRISETGFYDAIKDRWNAFLDAKMSRRTFLRGAKNVSIGAFASSLVVAGFHADQVELGVNWLATKMKAPDEPLVIPEQAEAKIQKAMLLYNNMITNFGTHSELMLENSRDLGEKYAMVWPYSRAIEATYAMRFVPGSGKEPRERYKNMLGGLENYWSDKPPDHKPGYDPGLTALNSYYHPQLRPFVENNGPDRYVDDNLWIGQILMREYWETKDKRLLHRAKQIFELAKDQWDHVQGGVYWKQQFVNEESHGRGIVSNAPAIMLGVELYKAVYAETGSGDNTCLEFCDKTFRWLQDNLKDSSDGLYFDNKDYTGKVGTEKFTYCQGVMIGAMVKLNEIDPARYKLDDAVKLANNSLTHFDKLEESLKINGRKHDPDDIRSEGYEDLAYTGIFFANLLYLAKKIESPEFTQRVQRTLDKIVSRLYLNHDKLLDHAGAVHLAALNCMAEEEYNSPYFSPLSIGA